MTKIYRVDIMSQSEPTYVTAEDVAKIIQGTNSGSKLVLIRQTLINPSSISRISRAYHIEESQLDPIDNELSALLGSPQVKRIKS